MRILIAPCAFKHSLSALQVARAIQRGLASQLPASIFELLPIADGGNGTLDAFLAQGGEWVSCTVQDALGREHRAEYGILPDGVTAVIEMARASGIELLQSTELAPLEAHTYGTGQLLAQAFERGLRRFIVGLGGSASTDGGMGALRALGVRFYDALGQDLPLGGGALGQLARIDPQGLDPRWRECTITLASDVQNPLVGLNGSAFVFAPQKGASPAQFAPLRGCDSGAIRHSPPYASRGRIRRGLRGWVTRFARCGGAFRD